MLNAAAWTIVSHPEFERDLYTLALELAQHAAETASGNWAILNTLGVAQYRAGRHERAVETLTRSDSLYVEAGRPEQPANWAFIAMSRQQLGHTQKARAALTKLHELMNNAENAASAENRQFLEEAVELIGAD